MTSGQLNSMLQNNVLDLKFTRRRPRAGVPATRRMLCTMDATILNSTNGRTVLNYLPPSNTRPYNMIGKNLSMAWDILMQDFRMISAESVTIVNSYPGNDTFWEVFNTTFLTMDQGQKIDFMNS
jgi:hypothetical protein